LRARGTPIDEKIEISDFRNSRRIPFAKRSRSKHVVQNPKISERPSNSASVRCPDNIKHERDIRKVPKPDSRSMLSTVFGERGVLDRAVILNGLPIHLALSPREESAIGAKFNS
jgi:hypothetical protein